MQYVSLHSEFATPDSSPWTDRDKKKCLEKVQEKVIGMASGLTARTYEGKLKEL